MPNEDTELAEVSTFVRVVEQGSMTAAARLLEVPRSTISRRIARLEEHLGVQLLRRTTRQMALTEEGQEYFERVGPPMRAIAEAGRFASDHASDMAGLIRLTAPTDVAASFLPQLLADFLIEHPDVDVEVGADNRVVDLVAEGFDLALRAGPLPDSSLVARRLRMGPMALFASPAYLDERGRPSRPEELQEHECLVFRPVHSSGVWSLTGPDDERVEVPVRGRMQGADFGFLHGAAIAGAGIALMPSFLGVRDVEQGRLERILEGWAIRGAKFHVVTPAGHFVPARVRALRDFIAKWCDAHAEPRPEVCRRLRERAAEG